MINKDCDELMPQIKQENTSSSDDIRQYLTKSWSQVMEDEINGKCDDEKKPDLTHILGSSYEDGLDKNKEIKPEIKSEDILIDFLDVSNEEKFEKLVSEEKLKTPFKRRLSSNSDIKNEKSDSENENEEVQTKKLKFGRQRATSNSSRTSDIETDSETILRREKQIDYGKNTVGYDNYIKLVPINKRQKEHPKTPNKNLKYSRRAWDGLIKIWRRELHCFDGDDKEDETIQSEEDI